MGSKAVIVVAVVVVVRGVVACRQGGVILVELSCAARAAK